MFTFEATTELLTKSGWSRSRRTFATLKEAAIAAGDYIYAQALVGNYVIVRLVRIDNQN